LLRLARGAHLRGLASLRRCRPLQGSILLVRPLLGIRRAETAAFCRQGSLPVWDDPSNGSMDHARNRIRHQVLPVLEALHPGAGQRLAAFSERLEEEGHPLDELLPLALATLATADANSIGLDRRRLMALSITSQRHLLALWLQQQAALVISSNQLAQILLRLRPSQGSGNLHLPQGWRLSWDRLEIRLQPPAT
jgi:tRNA(Ile)-lysidine synthase